MKIPEELAKEIVDDVSEEVYGAIQLNVHFGRNCDTCRNQDRDGAFFCEGCTSNSLASWWNGGQA